jgi:hypothetical protein
VRNHLKKASGARAAQLSAHNLHGDFGESRLPLLYIDDPAGDGTKPGDGPKARYSIPFAGILLDIACRSGVEYPRVAIDTSGRGMLYRYSAVVMPDHFVILVGRNSPYGRRNFRCGFKALSGRMQSRPLPRL